MLCPSCKTELRIEASRYEVTGDQSPDTPTEVYVVQELCCRNPQCERHGQVVETMRTKVNG